MRSHQPQKSQREQMGYMSPPVKRGVHDQQVELAVWILHQPAASVIDDQLYLWIPQQTCNVWKFSDQRQVTGIDFDDRQPLDTVVARNDLRPGSGREANHQNLLLRR